MISKDLMRRILTIFLAALPFFVFSQGKSHHDTVGHGNFIRLNVARLLTADLAVSYERTLSRKVSLEMEFGYQCALESHVHSDEGNPFFRIYQLLPGEGFSVEAGPKIYRLSRNHPGFYIQPWGIFKNMRCTDVSFRSSGYGDKEKCYPYGDNRYRVYGAAIRVGSMKTYGCFVMDFYAGAGIKVMDNHYNLYGYWDQEKEDLLPYNKDKSPDSLHKMTALPVISLGLKIGFGFGRGR